jgi:AcrR family transcriptional regulator
VTTTPVTDGRTARSARTRDAIADALLDLLGGGSLRPTAREIAAHAGVSLRSVYVHFDDLEDLFCVAATRHFARIAPMLDPIPATGPIAERARKLVAQRVRLYDQVGAVGRATQLHAPTSPTLRRILRDAHARSCTDLDRVFAPELDALAPRERASVVAVLDVLTGPAMWEALREMHGLGTDGANRAVVEAILRQLQDFA